MAEDFRIRGVIDAEARGFHRAVDGVLRRFRDLQGEHVKTAATARILEGQTRQLNRELERQSRQLGLLTLQFIAVRNAMRTLAIRTAITGFASLTATVAALAAGLAEAAQQATLLATAVGVVGASALMGLGQAALVAKLALDKVGKALTTTGQEHEKAMAKLTKPARDFVHELMDVQIAFREIKLVAQEGLFPGLTRGIKAAKPALDEFRQVIWDTANVMGYLGERIGEVVGRRQKDLERLGERNAITLRRFGDASINAGEALMDVFSAAEPFIGHVTAGIVTLSEKLKKGAAEARADGSLGHFFFELKETWDTWTATFGNVGGTLLNVFKAASGPAKDVADAIKSVTQNWEDWTGSKSGQTQITKFFESSNKVLESMAKFAGAIFESLARLSIEGGDNAVRFFDGLRTTLLPFLEDLAVQLNRGLFDHLMTLGGAFIRFAQTALPGLAPVSEAIGVLAGALTSLLDAIDPLIAKLPDVNKIPAALVLGGGILAGWSKIKGIIELAILRLRQFIGLTRETPVWGPGLRQLATMGGRQSGQPADFFIAPPGRSPNQRVMAGGSAPYTGPTAGPMGFQSIRPNVGPYLRPQATYTAETVNRLIRDIREDASLSGIRQIYTANRRDYGISGGRIGPAPRPTMYGPTSRPYGAAADPRQWIGSQGQYGFMPMPGQPYAFRDRMRVPVAAFQRVETGRTRAPYDLSPSTIREGGSRTQAYREFQNIDRTQRGAFLAMSEGIGGATHAGVKKGLTLAKPVMGLAFGAAAVSGIIGGLASNAQGWKGRVRDAVAGATFGIVPSTETKMTGTVAKVAAGIQTGNVLTSPGFLKDANAGDRKAGDLTTPEGRKNTKEFIQQLKDSGDIAADSAKKLNAMVDGYASRVAKLGPEAARLKGAIESGLDLGGAEAKVVTGVDNIQRAFADMRSSAGKNVSQIKAHVETNMSAISGTLDKDSQSGRLALARNFRLAAAAVKTSMKEGTIGTKEGTALIRTYLIDALQEVNPQWDRKQAGRYLHNKDPLTGKPMSGANKGITGAAAGALHHVPGGPAPDSVPMKVGGRDIVVAPGEDVAVFTRHQRKALDNRLSDVGGLPGFFEAMPKKHTSSYAVGGLVKGGGLVTGDTDYGPAMTAALESMARALNRSIFVQDGGRTLAEQRQRVATHGLYGPGNPTGAAAPSANAPHVRGIAADITPGRSVFGSAAGRFGLGFPVPGEPWHIQLLNALSGGSSASGGGGVAPTMPGVSTGMTGLIGMLADAGLDKVSAAARDTLDAAASMFGAGGGSETAPGGGGGLTGNRQANRLLGKHMAALMGWTGAQWTALDQLWTGESGWDDTVLNKQGSGAAGIPQDITGNLHGGAAGQIRWGLDYIKHRYGDPRSALAFWLSKSPHWYDTGGLLSFIAGGGVPPIPGRGAPPPSVNPDDAVTPGSSKPKAKAKPKKKKPGKPFTSGPNIPDVSKIRGAKAKKPKKAWTSKYKNIAGKAAFGPGFGGGELKDVDALIPNYEALFENPLQSAENLLSNLQGTFDLSDEEAIVSLYDSGSFDDLTKFWAVHPDLAKTYAGQIDSFDVLNTGGYTVQGKFVPGIDQHVNELLSLMGVHTGGPDPMGTGGVVGTLAAYAASIQTQGVPNLLAERARALNRLKQVHMLWNYEHRERELDRDQIHKLSAGQRTWQQRVGDNDAKIKVLQDFGRDIDDAAVGHRLTEEAKHKKKRASQQIADLRDENKSLRKNKPKAKSAATSHKINQLINSRNDHARELDFLAGSRDTWNTDSGVAGDTQKMVDSYNKELKDEGTLLARLTQSDIPQEAIEVSRIGQEIGAWRGTTIILPAPPAAADSQSEIDELLKAQNENLRRDLALATQQFEVFKGFAPLVGARLLGSFAHGGILDEAGLALVHKHERMSVEPDPEGPFGSQISPRVSVGGARLELHLHGEHGLQRVALRDQGSSTEVSQNLGRRARLLTIAPGGQAR